VDKVNLIYGQFISYITVYLRSPPGTRRIEMSILGLVSDILRLHTHLCKASDAHREYKSTTPPPGLMKLRKEAEAETAH
jgi:hypothetical protein